MTSRITSWHGSLAVLLAGCWMGEYVALQVHGKYLAFALPAGAQ